MARTGLCDSRTLLDSRKTEERPPLRTWANVCGTRERRFCTDGEERRHQNPHTHPNTTRVQVRKLSVCTEDEVIMSFCQKDSISSVDSVEQETVLSHLAGLQAPPPLRDLCVNVDSVEQEAVLSHLAGLQAPPPLRDLLPGLLRREMEVAMDKLGLLYDRSYAWDVFLDMMRGQLRCTLPDADLPRPFSEHTRAILVDWLIQVHVVFNFSEETLYLAVQLLNRALRCVKVSVSNLQLLGVVCLFISAKKEECLLPEVSELCYLMANTYSKKQFLKMERRVLSALQFDLFHCPPIHFLLISAYISHCSDQVVCMARYLLELSLCEGVCVVYLPAQLAGAALCLARRLLQDTHTYCPKAEMLWCISSTIHGGSEETLNTIIQIMAAAAARASSRETRATFLKYSTSETHQVSLHPALNNLT